jgi:DNA-directed DNA polymerase III PolC
MFIHLNCHSNYSFLAGDSPEAKNNCHVVGGANSIDDLVRHASTLGYPALALTDTNGLYGAVSFYQSARKAGIKPIFGTEIVQGTRRAALLAKNLRGFAELCRVITDRHLKPDFSLTERLKQCNKDVIILCPDEIILQSLLATRGRENLYLEIGPSALTTGNPFPMVATNPIRFIRPEDWQVHWLLTAIKTNTTIHSVPRSALAPREAWMKSPDEMARLFQDIPSAIANTLKIAEQCNVELPIGETLFPRLPVKPGYLKKLAWEGVQNLYHGDHLKVAIRQLRYELKVINDLNFSSYFLIVWDIVREAKERGIPTVGRGSAANSLVCRALGITEVDPIALNLYFERFLNPERSDYPDIDIDFPWNRRDEMLDYVFKKYGPENVALISAHVHFRGRSALREVGKALGVPIPEIDALTSRLPHFSDLSGLEEIRENVPECRDLLLEDEPYRSMISLANRIDGFPRHLSIHCGGIVVSPFPITDRIPLQRTAKGLVVTQYDMYPVEDMGLLKIDLLAQKGLAVLADTLCDVESHYGKKINFNGVAADGYDIFPQLSCPEGVNAAVTLTRPPKKSLFPPDMTRSRQVVDPVRDPETQKLIREGKTIGCFYIESPGMRNLLRKLQVDSFEMLTAASSIIRPGVSESGMMKAFIAANRRCAGQALRPASNDPLPNSNSLSAEEKYHAHRTRPGGKWWMEEILKDTYGIMIYQEDVIKVAHTIGGMSLGEADSLRKCMSKKRDWQDIRIHRDRFVSGAIKNGMQKQAAEEIWRQIESFAGYAFCKAHSASFAIVSYQTAYLKAHYPAEFMAAVLSNRGGFYDACAYTEETRRMGIEILPPDIHLSEERFTATSVTLDPIGNRSIQQTKSSLGSKNPCQLPPRQAVRVGLSQVKGLSQNSIDEIIKNRPYTSLADFLARTKISVSETESLIRCEAFNTLEANSIELLWQLKLHRRRPRGKSGLFSQSDPSIPKLPEYTLQEKLLAELECLDLTVSDHLLHHYSFSNNKLAQTAICGNQLEKFSGKLATLVGWAITFKRTRTVKNELMKFITLEDTTATFEVTLFPRVYKQFGHLLHDRGPYIVRGRIEQEGHCHTVTALWVHRLDGTS